MSPDLLRPTFSAPDVSVVGAYAPDTSAAAHGWETRSPFAVLSGTSMASPQVAGAGALLTQVHPTWSSVQMHSALMTTFARPAMATVRHRRWPSGAGRVDSTAAAEPALVIAPNTAEYRAFAEQPCRNRDLNLPSIQIGSSGRDHAHANGDQRSRYASRLDRVAAR
jgi:subtilisin family serine protease